MLPSAEDVLEAHRWVALRRGLKTPANPEAVDAALREAEALAHGTEDDEPAALFYAFVRYRRAFGDGWRVMGTLLARNQARPRILDATDEELQALRLAVFHGEFPFQDVRAWFAARLRSRH